MEIEYGKFDLQLLKHCVFDFDLKINQFLFLKQQEDAHVANPKFLDSKDRALFGVFDGHGGREVA